MRLCGELLIFFLLSYLWLHIRLFPKTSHWALEDIKREYSKARVGTLFLMQPLNSAVM